MLMQGQFYSSKDIWRITRGMQSIVGRAELAIAVQTHRRAAELSGLLHIVLLYEVGIR